MSTSQLIYNDSQNSALAVTLTGSWLLGGDLPSADSIVGRLAQTPKPASLNFETEGLTDWDTGLVTTLIAILQSAEENGVQVDASGLPDGAQRLIALALAVKEREGARRSIVKTGFFESVGGSVLSMLDESKNLLTFTGELILSFGRFARGKATYLRSDFLQYCYEAGVAALPIVSLISFLIGMIFAFVGIMQLNMFGAGIYTANLVAVAMIREMAAIMTAIVMAGRTGAAYAAQIGTMKVNEEVDALTTLGMNPFDFLVTPRVVALIIMMPLLTMYSSLMGIIGGTVVGLAMLDVTFVQYAQQTLDAVHLNSLFGGLFKAIVYGSLVALAGCQQGMACGSSALAVGQSTTKAVVMGIVLIVVSAAILTVIYINLGV
jgi:phospholipid/cholesterol/gamma-HCH transport system permease protein